MTCNPYKSGPDFYDLRLPQESWHYGEAMITTNTWTDGTYTPGDEDFGADAYYDDETPKTQESHWNLLAYFGGHRGLHMLSVAYRDRGDMTVWAIGKLSALEKTPRLEYEWSDLLDLEPPEAPDIDGPVSGIVGIEYEYYFSTTDPDEDDVYYYIEWGDGQVDEWVGPYKSGELAKVSHTWTSPDDYEIRAKAKDTNNLESEWSDVYPVTIVESEPPSAPTIEGKTSGGAGTSYLYTFTS
jgi:hypothetical protein